MKKETYSVVVESGSCSPDYRRWEERSHCGHEHRSIEAADKCAAKLTRSYCQHGRPAGTTCGRCFGLANADSTSAKWWGARIHNQHGERIGA